MSIHENIFHTSLGSNFNNPYGEEPHIILGREYHSHLPLSHHWDKMPNTYNLGLFVSQFPGVKCEASWLRGRNSAVKEPGTEKLLI